MLQRLVRFALILTVAGALVACSSSRPGGRVSSTAGASHAQVGKTGSVSVTAGAATVRVPAGAAKLGTSVTATPTSATIPAAAGPSAAIHTIGQPVKIALGSGIQPKKDLTFTEKVKPNSLIEYGDHTPHTMALLLIHSTGKADMVRASWNASTDEFSAEVPHLSIVWPIQINIKGLLHQAEEVLEQTSAGRTPKPDCVGKSADIDHDKFSVNHQPKQAWICVRNANGQLGVKVSPNSAVPFEIKASEPARATDHTSVSQTAAITSAVSRSLFGLNAHTGLLFQGGSTSLRMAPNSGIRLESQQNAGVLLVQILASTLAAIAPPEKLSNIADKLECAAKIEDTGLRSTHGLSSSVVAGVVGGFFSCVGQLLEDLPGPAKVMIAIISAAPTLLSGALEGFIENFTANAAFTVNVTDKRGIHLYNYGSPGIRIGAASDVNKRLY
jgi:hypothetical protein